MCLLAFLEAVCLFLARCQGAAYPHNESNSIAYKGSLELLLERLPTTN